MHIVTLNMISALPYKLVFLDMNEFDKHNYELWKWGIFYYNPNDPTIWVEKRNGLGWTLNFAHSKSWFIILMFIALAVVFLFKYLS